MSFNSRRLRSARLWPLALALAVSLAACSDDASDESTANNASANNGSANNTSANNGSANDASANNDEADAGQSDAAGESDTGAENDAPPPAELPRITALEYSENTVGCPTSNCGRAIAVNVVSQRITYARNGSGPSYGIDAADAESFTERVVTDTTYERMRNGFDCPAPTTNETEFRFEGRILVDGEYRQSIQDISGCIEAEDEHVLAIVAVFEELRVKYYSDDIDE